MARKPLNGIPKLREALDWLDDHYAHFLTNVLNMGTPTPDYSIQATSVTLDNETASGFKFLINPDFAKETTVPELAYALSHETLHILMGHFNAHPRMTDIDKITLAGDLIINDYLYQARFTLLPGSPRGPEILGVDCSQYDLEDVYNMLTDELMEELAQQNGEGDPEDGEGDGEPGEGEPQEGQGQGEPKPGKGNPYGHCGSGHEHEKVSKKQAEKAQEQALKAAGKELPADIDPNATPEAKASLAGSGFNTLEAYAKSQGTTLKWMELLAIINPDIKNKVGAKSSHPKPSWHEPRRKLASIYPQVILPTVRPDEKLKDKKGDKKPSIVLALDTSGSIPRETVQQMQNLARSVPEDLIEVRACTFTTRAVPFDHTQDHNTIASGGTDFSCIEEFIQSLNTESYPKAVVVITDLYADFNTVRPTDDQLKENWTWLTTEASDDGHYLDQAKSWSGEDRVRPLQDFL